MRSLVASSFDRYTGRVRLGVFLALTLGGCASVRPAPAVHAASSEAPTAEQELEPDDEDAPMPASVPPTGVVDTPERSRPPSTASYEQALSAPERIDIHDDRVHLTDSQLRGPMRGIVNNCRVPPSAKVTIKTAVQYGRAIGVTVDVQFPHAPAKASKSAKHPPPTPAAVKREAREAKAKKKVLKCLDHAVRDVVWPPSNRRDSFTTEF